MMKEDRSGHSIRDGNAFAMHRVNVHFSILTAMTLALFVGASACSGLRIAQPTPGPARSDTPSEPAVVEYLQVEGDPCLQPKIISGRPEDSDFVAAQKRWLAWSYPGYHLVHQEYLLTLAREYREPGQGNDEHGPEDVVNFETADGKRVSVCFGLKPRGSTQWRVK